MITKSFILTNPLTKRLYPLFLHYLDGQNIEWKLQNLALDETARFVAANFNGVPAFKNDFDLLRHALTFVKAQPNELFLEFGVYRGRTINFIARFTSEIVHGFDSFEGLPETWRPKFEKGRFRVARLPKVRTNVKLYKGWFENSLPEFVKNHSEKIAFLHVDCDLYSSTKTIFNHLKKQIRPGTVIVFDEFFNYPGWQQGEFKAFNELIAETGFSYEWLGYCCYHEQVAVLIK
jgi:hypothetical protein